MGGVDVALETITSSKEKFENFDEQGITSIEDFRKMDEERITLTMDMSQQNEKVATIEASLDRLDSLRKEGVYDREEKCSQCGSGTKIYQTQEDIERIEYQIFQQENVRVLLLKDIESMNKKLGKLKKLCGKIKEFLSYKDLLTKEKVYQDQKYDLSAAIKDHGKKKTSAAVNYEVMKFWEKAFSEQGLIKFVIRNILDFFNKKCNTYLSRLTNRQFYLEFDEELQEIVATNKRNIPYISLSGGEKRKINLAVLLALQDLLAFSKKSKSNILFLDEVTENLDDKGISGLCNLLQDLKTKRKIFIITHNKELKSLFEGSDKISIIKSKGISKIKNHGNERTK